MERVCLEAELVVPLWLLMEKEVLKKLHISPRGKKKDRRSLARLKKPLKLNTRGVMMCMRTCSFDMQNADMPDM
jgi:hypothetical protein